jgi:peptide/nickel transport system substrate-binding protein
MINFIKKGKPASRLAATVAVLALAGGTLAGCSSGGGASAGGTITYLTHAEAWTHADPSRNYTGQHIAWFSSYLQRTLTTYNRAAGVEGSSLAADLATDTGRASNGNKTWEFTLRDGVTFDDGSAITCEDVKYGVSRVFATDVIVDGPTYAIGMLDIPKAKDGSSVYKGPYATTGNDTAAYDKAVTCSEDNKTITFNLSRPVGDFNYTTTYLAFGPVPKAKDNGDGYDMNPVSSGPYKIEKYERNGEMVLVRNENWNKDSDPVRADRAHPDKVVVRFGLAEEVLNQMILSDSEQAAFSLDGVLPTNLPTIFNEDGTVKPEWEKRAYNVYDPYVTYAAVNVKKVPCLEIRKAIYYAKDWNAIITLLGGQALNGDPADGVIKPIMGLDYKKITGYEDWKPEGNIEKAKALMAEAKTKCPTEYARATDPKRGLVYDSTDTESSKKTSAIWIDSLKKAGIVMKFNFIEPGKYYAVVLDATKQSDLSGGGWAPDWANASTVVPELFTETGGFPMSQNWSDPAYPAFKAMIDKALIESDRKKQGEMWAAANQYAMDQMWVIPSVFSKSQDVWGSKLGGVFFWEPQGTASFGDIYVIN